MFKPTLKEAVGAVTLYKVENLAVVLFWQHLLTLRTMEWDPFCYDCCTKVYARDRTHHVLMTFPCICWQMNVTTQQLGLGTENVTFLLWKELHHFPRL